MIKVTIILAPEQPSGWPLAQAPPKTFNFSIGIFKILLLTRDTTAKASLISKKSISSWVLPASFKAFGIAKDGAVVKWAGSWAASPQPIILAIGFKPKASTFSFEANTIAAAPSLIVDEFGAVTVPSVTKAGLTVLNLASLS